METNKDKTCWNCHYRRDLGDSFLGICTWFEESGKGKNKEIPPVTVDNGCKWWSARGAAMRAGN